MDFLQNIIAVWRNVSIVQRALLVSVLVAVVIMSAILFQWVSKPDMRFLYGDLPAGEASKITDKISEQGIAFEIRNGGKSIYVPKNHVYQLRMDLAKDGLPQGGQKGYSVFDEEKLGTSPFVQNVNLQVALQEEIAQSIQMFEGIEYCRVHIVSANQSAFLSKSSSKSASVIVKLRSGFVLTGSNIAAITNLVAGGIEGLTPDKVKVVDSNSGQLLSGASDQPIAAGASTVQDYKDRVEKTLTSKAEKMLERALGQDRAVVQVSAVVDMTSINLTTEKYDKKGTIAKKETVSNSEPIVDSDGTVTDSKKTQKNETSEYMVPMTTEQRIELPGQIKSLSVAAFVDLRPLDANGVVIAGADPIMTVANIEGILKSALGLTETDTITVVETEMSRAMAMPVLEEQGGGMDLASIAKNASLGIAAVCALLVLKIFSGAKKKASGEEGAVLAQLPGVGNMSAGMLPAGGGGGGESAEPMYMRKQIASALKKNPGQVKQLFESWVNESGG